MASFYIYDSAYGDNSESLEVDINKCFVARSAEITAPLEGELVSGMVSFDAILTDDDDNDDVQWAVRKGTCAAGTNTVFGNVDGYSDSFTWTNKVFNAVVDTSSWELGEYCFIFNPTEGTSEDDIRLTRKFVLVDNTAPIVTIESPSNGSFVSGTVDIFGTIVEDYELSHYNIAIYNGDADFMNFSKRLEWKTQYQSSGFNNQLIYSWDTTAYPDGEYLIRLAARDKARNRNISGDPYLGGDDSQHVITVIVENDEDNDGVLNDDDKCLGTNPDTKYIELGLGVNRHVWTIGKYFNTSVPAKKGTFNPADSEFSIAKTYGCSCEQILDKMSEILEQDFEGHYKFGCSKGLIEDWIAGEYYIGPTVIETVEVPANDADGVSSDVVLEIGKDYFLKAYGTAWACNQSGCKIEFDAKYSISHSITDDWTDNVTKYESYGPTLLDLFVNGGSVDWGEYNSENTYQIPYVGTDNSLFVVIYDLVGSYSNNAGSLFVEIIEDKWVALW